MKNIKAGEGLVINLPTGKPAFHFTTYRDLSFGLTENDNMVSLCIKFDKPFIPNKTTEKDKK